MLLTVAEARGLLTTSLDDDALRAFLDAAEETIAERLGPLVEDALPDRVERGAWQGPLARLARRAASMSSVVEGDVMLGADDYALRPGGEVLERLATGTHPAARWNGLVTITYTPASDIAERCRLQAALVKLDLAHRPGIAAASIGPWSESYAAGRSYAQERADILESYAAGFGFGGLR
jgi:hypothetical protein